MKTLIPETFPASRNLRLGDGRHKEEITLNGRFSISRYFGEGYSVPSLQTRANLGHWYARAMGCGSTLEGEGSTPAGALSDLQKRALAERDELNRIFNL